jgi:plastocyanin
MQRQRVGLLVVLATAGLTAGLFFASGGGAASQGTIRVAVSATESRFTLSTSSGPIGTVIFTVTNRGKVAHNFKIAGKKTPLLTPGHSATLRVTFSTKGRYPYVSTVSGQASAGLKGTFVVFATPPTKSTTTSSSTTTGAVGNASTTVSVEMFDSSLPGFFKLSQASIPSGMVTFEITNKCNDQCSFDLVGIKAGAILNSGQSETWTVALAPGIYRFHCDVLPAMMGALTVTP